MKGKRAFFYTLFTVAATAVIFFVRRGWERPFFALTDGLSIGGFLGLLVALAPRAATSESFDGFSYALAWAAAGLFPKAAKSYSDFKKERAERRGKQEKRDSAWLAPLLFFSLGTIFSLFFL